MRGTNLLCQRRLCGSKNQSGWDCASGAENIGGEKEQLQMRRTGAGRGGTTISTRNSSTMDDAREIKKRKRGEKKTEVWGVSPCAVHGPQKASRARWLPSARGCSSRRFSELNQAGELAGH